MSGDKRMTRAEAIKLVKSDGLYSQEVIDALEDKPAISKERIEEILVEYGVAFTDCLADRLVKEFLAQEPKIGHWIRVTDKTGHLVWECDNCGWQQRFNTNFCPDCGCRMVEPQESEDKG